MIKKILCIVNILFVFMSSIAVAEMHKKEDIIKINDIQMVEHVAYKIVNYAVRNKIDVLDKNEQIIDTKFITEDEIYIKQCDLMDIVNDLYSDVINNAKKDTATIIEDRAKKLNDDTEVTIYVNKESLCIEGLIM